MPLHQLQANWSPYLWWINWHPAGTLLPSAEADDPGLITLRDQQWKAQSIFRGHTDGVNAAVWGPRGKLLLTASWDGTVYLWEPGNRYGKKVRLSASSIESAFWSPGGTVIAALAHDGYIHLLDASLNPSAKYRVEGPLFHGCFSGDGASLFACGTSGLFQIEIASGKTYRHPVPGEVIAAACSPDGNDLYATTGEGTVVRISGPERSTLYTHTSPGRGLALSNDGLLAAGFADGCLVILGKSGELKSTTSFTSEVTALTWHPQLNRLFLGTRGGPAGMLTLC